MNNIESSHDLTITRLKGLRHLIGNTPLIAIHFTYKGKKRIIYAKSENLNMTGSIKDRMALYIMQAAYDNGHIKPGDTVVEADKRKHGDIIFRDRAGIGTSCYYFYARLDEP